MNEILFRKHLKIVMKYGVPMLLAREIVSISMEVAEETGTPHKLEAYIDYAIDLTYGFGLSQKAR